MTLDELYSVHYLQDEVNDYKAKIRELEETAESITAKLTGMPRGGGNGDKVGDCATMIAFYKSLLEDAIVRKIKTETAILKYIENVEDAELRRIMWLRFVKVYTWRDVAYEIGGNNTEDSVRKRCNRFVTKSGGTSEKSA